MKSIARAAAPLLFLSFLLLLSGSAGAQTSQEPQTDEEDRADVPCSAPEYRQMDFWLGEWDVYGADGKFAGRNRISAVAEGCALLERWEGAGGVSGVSLTFYDPAAGVWRQKWVGGLGLILELEGGWDGERMLLRGGTRPGREGPVADRIGWNPVDGGEVLQVWEITRDGGETWEQIFTGTYRRRSQAGTTDVREPAPAAQERLYIVHFTTGLSWVDGKPFLEQEHAREHSANLWRLKEQGRIAIGARYDQTGMVILRAASEEAARAEILSDPAVRSGVFHYTLAELVPFFTGCVP